MIKKRQRSIFNIEDPLEFPDLVDNLGTVNVAILFISGVIWAFIAVNNFETPTIFKLSLIYSLLLIFGFIGLMFDRSTKQLGIDSRLWDGSKLKAQILVSVIVFALWYLVFMSSGFAVATPQSVTGGSLFSVSPALNFFLTSVLGPLAENIFFFGVVNMTLIYILRKLLKENNRAKIIVSGLVLLAISPLFTNVPNSLILLAGAGILLMVAGLTKIEFLQKHAPVVVSALIVGGVVFPKFHSFAYQLNEKSFIAAQTFGVIVCIIVSYMGLLPVDLLHIANNAAVSVGLG